MGVVSLVRLSKSTFIQEIFIWIKIMEQSFLSLAKFGQTGTGKTSLSNTLFGLNWSTDYAVACTQTVMQHKGKICSEFALNQDLTLQIFDTPGVGESEYADNNHFEDIQNTFHSVDVILWVVQADTRAFAEDQKALLKLTEDKQKVPDAHYVIALNQIDRVYPENWDVFNNKPSSEQLSIISKKIDLVLKRFSSYIPIKKQNVIPCSVLKNYGISTLVKTICNIQ